MLISSLTDCLGQTFPWPQTYLYIHDITKADAMQEKKGGGGSQFTNGLFVKFLPYPVVGALPALPQKLARMGIGSMAWVSVCSFHRLRSSLSWEKW